jgi:hypothetical protein
MAVGAAITGVGVNALVNSAKLGLEPLPEPSFSKSSEESPSGSASQTSQKTGEQVANETEKTHGNKLDDKPAEGYSLQDRDTGAVQKYGETTRGEDKFGEGNQKRYSKDYLKKNNVDYVKEASGTKKDMHQWQHDKIVEHKEQTGSRPPLNKSDY